MQLAATVAEEFWSAEPARRRLDLQIAESGVLPARGDVDSLAIALRNLVENALRYSRRRPGDDRGRRARACWWCATTARACRPRPLETLRHRHVRQTGDAAGYGLGLSIVGTIVDKHGGRLELSSPPPGREPRLRGPADPAAGTAGRRRRLSAGAPIASGRRMSPPRPDALPAAPIEPMLAKVAEALPAEGDFLFEPKWDGFRALVFRGARREIAIQSRDLREFDRYFPELHAALAERLPPGCIVDGEIVVVGAGGLDFDALQQRLHPAASRVAKLALATPASFVAFDLLAPPAGRCWRRARPSGGRRWSSCCRTPRPPLHLTPATRDRAVAAGWLREFEGAGLDGVDRQAAGRRLPAGQAGDAEDQAPAHRRLRRRRPALAQEHDRGRARGGRLAAARPVRRRRPAAPRRHHRLVHDGPAPRAGQGAGAAAPRRARRPSLGRRRRAADPDGGAAPQRLPGATSRWSAGKDLSWVPLRPERVCEVRYDHLQGDRFRHATTFLRWRPDKPPGECRYDQLEVVPPYALKRIFGAGARRG